MDLESEGLSAITVRLAKLDVAAVDADGVTAILSGVDLLCLPLMISPRLEHETQWVAAEFTAGTAEFTILGFEATADPVSTPPLVVVPEPGGILWGRIRDNPEVDAVPLKEFFYL